MGRNLPVDYLETLRSLMNAWDPLRVAHLVDDEYDCMFGPLVSLLVDGGDRAAIGEYLSREMKGHFGVDPRRCGVDEMADRLAAWAATWP